MHANCRRSLHNFLLHAVSLLLFSIATLAEIGPPSSKDGCLLQQRSSSQRSPNALLEDLASSKAPTMLAKSSPSSGGMMSLVAARPTVSPKSSPRSGSKAPHGPRQDSRRAHTHRTSTTTMDSRIRATPLEDIVDEDFMSQRGELHLAVAMESLQESSGSLYDFAESLRMELLTTVKDLDPKRLVILGIRGEYVDSGSGANATILSQTARSGSQIDFEVYPGPPGQPTPGGFLKSLATEMKDMRGRAVSGPMKKVLAGATMVVVQGSKVRDPTAEFGVRQADKHRHKEGAGTMWFPWQWYHHLLGNTRMGSSPGIAFLLPLALWAAMELFP